MITNVIAVIKSVFIKKEKPTFPEKLGEYYYAGNFKKVGPRKSYPLAMYQNKKGQKGIAKMIGTRIKGIHYYSLLNEITMYSVLNATIKRIGKNMPNRYKDVYIPQLLCTYEDAHVLISLVEFVEGKVAENEKPEKKIPLYFRMIEFLHFMGEKLSKSEKERISQRTSWDYVLLYPFLVAKAIITYPRAIPHILLGALLFVRSLPAIVRDSNLSLVHRDLHFMNILLLKNGNIALVDFQQCVYTEPLHEAITTLRYWWKGWKSEKFGQLLMKEIMRKYNKRKNFKKLFQGYAINSVTHGLTGSGFSKKIIDGWIDFLKFSIHPNFEKYEK